MRVRNFVARKSIDERVLELEGHASAAVCILSLPPGDLTATLHACKLLRGQFPGLNLVVARLGESTESERSDQLLRAAGVRHIASALEELSSVLRQLVREAPAIVNAAQRDAPADSVRKGDSASDVAMPLAPVV